MAPERWTARAVRALTLVVFAALTTASTAHALRVVNYNIMFYPSVNVAGRNPYFQQVMAPLGADIVVVQEVNNSTGVAQFRDNVLNVIEPGQWASAPYSNGPDSNNELFYRTSKVELLGSWFWLPPDNLRHVNVYRLRPVGYTNVEFRIYSLHLKAGDTSGDEARRLTDATSIRDSMNNVPPGTHCILTGDFNVYRSTDNAFEKFLESQGDNDGRVYDPLNAVGEWQDNVALASIHSQCPSTTAYRPSGSYSGGGIDDRFDMFLPTFNWNDGEGLDLLVSTYKPVGNDGMHLNKSVTDPPIAPADTAYARALWWASDHLPIRVDLQLPAQMSMPSTLAFGSVIVGATANQSLSVSNPAPVPADELDYALAADPGFTAPGGPLTLAAGATPANHAIGMDTGTPGVMSGYLLVSSDAPDSPTAIVTMSGTVLDHAQASLDSTTALLAQTLDFGSHAAGGFPTLMARVHDRGYHSLRARLAVNSGAIVGGDGRFSIVGGFSSALVSGVAQTYTVQFNEAGATPDLDYEATLAFASTDEGLPGATAQRALTVSLHARVTGGAVGVPGGPVIPTATRLYPPFPNPIANRTTVHFDLAREADLELAVYDLAGRRVATIAEGAFPPGQYSYPWDGRARGGTTLGSGLYFVRLSLAGMPARIARLAILR